jgi:hypothetical protein
MMAQQVLADLLVRTGELTEARRMAEKLTAARPDDPRNFQLLSRVHKRADNASLEQKVLTDALKRFPRNEEIRLSEARLLQKLGRSAEASAVVQTGLQILPESQPLLLASAGLEIDRSKKLADVEQYLARGGGDPLAPLLGMEAVPVRQRAKYLELFISKGGLSRQELVVRAMDTVKGNAALSASLRDAMGGYTGTRDLDADSDGYWEERWVFENGKVLRWMREPFQDGVARNAAEFRDGKPVSLWSRDSAGKVTALSYSTYPSLEKATLPGDGTYVLVPYTMQFPFLRPDFASQPIGTAPRAAAKIDLPSVDALRRASYQLEQYAPDGVTPVRRVQLSAGERVFMEESSAGDGVLDHRVWYSRGQPEKGARSLSRDGVFQVTEAWKNGRLASEVVDTDGDGTPDYRVTYGETPVKSWDFNGDGRDDSREYAAADGTIVRELATRLNGVFDLKIATRDSRIVSFTRAGSQVPIARDGTREVTWIGRPAPGTGAPDPARADGIQTIGGRQYLVFRLAGVLYAEAVEE